MFNNDLLEDSNETELDMTPLIDVVFILLVFFILTSTFIRPAIPLNLPRAESAGTPAERPEQLEISISSAGEIFIKGISTSPDLVGDQLQNHPDLPINLQVDRAAPFDRFLAVMDAARLQHRTQIAITTEAVPHE
jgi:biopolymer transport protein ExbD